MTSDDEKITIIDIAQHANVSPSTVSRVLRGTARVSKSKHEAVMRAVAELDYRPNVFAQSLASGQSMTVGVITQNVGSPFYDAILLGILQGLEHSRYSSLFVDGRWQEAVEERMIDTLLDRRVDGLILLGGLAAGERLHTIARQKPLVIVARNANTLPEHCITVNNFEGAYQATRYLVDMGHRNIAHITSPTANRIASDDVSQRLAGFTAALEDAGIGVDPKLVVEGNLLQQSGVLAVERLLMQGRPFSAIFAANDQMAFGARLALYRRGLRVPEDVSLLGFDDHYQSAYMIPPLTTVRQPAVELGNAAAAAILEQIGGQPPAARLFETQLIIRESVARLR